MKAFRSVGLMLVLVTTGCLLAPCQEAQQKLPLQNLKDASGAPRSHLAALESRVEAESIEIGPGGAIPAEIHRPAGKFILLLTNRSKDSTAAFVVDPAAIGDGVVGPEPLLRLVDTPLGSKHRVAGLIELPAGEFHLKSVKSGKILCRFTIE